MQTVAKASPVQVEKPKISEPIAIPVPHPPVQHQIAQSQSVPLPTPLMVQPKENKEVDITECFNNICMDLSTISKINVGHKLRIDENKLKIDDRYFQSLRRFFSEDDLCKTLNHIKKTIESCAVIKDAIVGEIKLIQSKSTIQTLEKNDKYRNAKYYLQKLLNLLKRAQTGLSNLKLTYSYDINSEPYFEEYDSILNKIFMEASIDITVC